MSLKTLLGFLFGQTEKSRHLREKAEEFLFLLRDRGMITVKEAKQLINAKKTYFKITKRLRSVGLISLTKNLEGDFSYSLTLDAYKFFVKKQLIGEVESVLKKPRVDEDTNIFKRSVINI